MGLQKYRADETGLTCPNGAIPVYSRWMFGPSLALIRNCPCSDGIRRTVYIQGEPDTFFSQPAAVSIRGKRVRGFVTSSEGGMEFTISRADNG